MSDLAKTLATVDIQALNRQQLQMYCRLIREQSGADIRLNSTNEKLREYITAYISEQATAAREAALQGETEPSYSVNDFEDVKADLTEFQALPELEDCEPYVVNMADFEGVTDGFVPLGDWWASCPLCCDVCNYQSCDLPQTDLIESLEKLFAAPEPDDAAQIRAAMADSTVIVQSQSTTITTYYQYRGIDIQVCEESGESYYQVRCWVNMFGADCDSGDVEESLSMAQALIDRRILFSPTDIEARLVREIRYRRDLENQDIPF